MRILLTLLTLLALTTPATAQVTGPWAKVVFGSDSGPFDSSGTSSPENVVIACPGSTFRQTDGTAGNVFWIKDGGTGCDDTGWIILAGGGGGGSHNLLSATHSDTTANAVVRGTVITGQSGPVWGRLTPTTTGQVLRYNGTDTLWSLDGSLFEDLNATELTTGTVPDARLSANVSLFGAAVDSSEITNGTIVFADWHLNGCSDSQIPKVSGGAWICAADEDTGGGGGAPADLSFWTSTAEAGASNETNIGALTTGLLKITVGGGIATPSTATAGTDYYAPGGTDVALADGGTGASLADPGADRILFWDDSAGAVDWLTIGANLSVSTTTLSLSTTLDLGGSTVEIPNSNTLPATCVVGQIYMDTDATTGERIYACESTDTWVLQGGGGGGSGHTIEDEGTPLTTRSALNFTGSGVSCVDNSGADSTDCTISGGGSGAWSLRFPALANAPPASNPATFDVTNNTPYLEFDTTTQETAIFISVLPDSYAGGGIEVCAHWAADTATSGTIGWDVAFEYTGDGTQNISSDGFATAQTITAATVPGTAGLVDVTCVTATDGANIDSLAAGGLFRLRIRRDVANDTATGDALLLAVDLKEP